jgi:energy-coupling factor transport system permease protein
MIDPRTKLLGMVPCLFIVFFLPNPLSLFVFLIMIQILYFLSKQGRLRLGTIWKSILPLCLFIMILWPLFEPSQQNPFYEGRFVKIGFDNLLSALKMGLRLASLVFISYYPLITVKQSTLLLAFIKLGIPYHWALTTVMAMESVPDLTGRWHQIKQAQQLRGRELDKGHFLNRLRNLIPLLTAVIVSALRDSETLSYSLINRGMELKGKRTWLETLTFHWYDGLIIFLLTSFSLYLIINPWPVV